MPSIQEKAASFGNKNGGLVMKCSQCDKPAVVTPGPNVPPLCVDHYLKFTRAIYLVRSMNAAVQNMLADQLSFSTGIQGIAPRMEIPPPPFIGDNLTLHNINVSNSPIGAINTGTVQNLDASITIMNSQGHGAIAAAITELTEAILASNELNESTKNEIAEQLSFLTAQLTAAPKDRSTGVVKSLLGGIRSTISAAAGLLAIWEKVEPLFRSAFGF